MVISAINQKGGVGKTTVSVNLAAALSTRGKRVLVIDLDPQANASAMLNVRADVSIYDVLVSQTTLESIIVETPIAGVSLAPGHLALSSLEIGIGNRPGREMRLDKVIQTVRDRFDYIIIDNAPAPLSLASVMSLLASDMALIPFKAESLSLEGLAQVCESIDEARDAYPSRAHLIRRILVTMLDNRTSHGPALVEVLRENLAGEVFDTTIPQSADLAKCLDHAETGGTVLAFAPRSVSTKAFKAVAAEVEATNGA